VTELAGSRVLVVGLGVSGYAAARALRGVAAAVRVTEGNDSASIRARAATLLRDGIAVEIGGHDLDALEADLAVLSPGIPPHSPVVRALVDRGVPVISEVECAYRLAECDFLAVTGTNGKTTTTSLLAAMLREGGIECLAAGNIGTPLAEAVAQVSRDGAIVLEASSFQLETIERFRPGIAVLLNVAEDHMDWHTSFDDYVAAKARLIENQRPGDVFLPNFEDPLAMKIAGAAASRVVPFSARALPEGGIGVDGGHIVYGASHIVPLDEVPLPGLPGLEDTAAAAGAALSYGVDGAAVRRAIREFRSLHHRLEVVGVVDGVTYIDDSKATNPHATLSAVETLENVVLVAGGRSKGIDLSPLAYTVPPVIAVVALGEAAHEIERIFDGIAPVTLAADMDQAVRLAAGRAEPGATVLLSPACASLDMYENYAARGRSFASAVGDLTHGKRMS
jgi:UDP-N-acetylmuramoylalanine--D-glutamate ligase